jgi:prepilin-type N-terminal cleavage/methylation domain-containing protein
VKKLKGFTIIELLIVVAIISVLAAVVLVNVTGYINKGKNTAIKANLASLLTNGSIFFNSTGNGTYFDFCSSSYASNTEAAIKDAGESFTCVVSPTFAAWCSCSTMKVTNIDPISSSFCVDSTGYKKVTQNAGLCAKRCTSFGSCID